MGWMRRLAVGALALTLLAASGCGRSTAPHAASTELRIYNWSDYIDPALLAQFTRETGIHVTYDTFDSAEVLETRVLTGGSGYDLVVPSNQYVTRFIAAQAIQPLDRSRLTGFGNLDPALMSRMAAFDPGNRFAVPYMWGTQGIGYNREAVARALPGVNIDSWRVVFDPANLERLSHCGVYFLDDSQDMFSAVLRFMGKDPNSATLADYDAATQLLMRLRPYVRRFDSSAYIDALANGDICVAIGNSGDVLQARDRANEAGRGVHIAYAVPQEGAQLWFDSFTIPVDAPHADAAHRFIAFMLRPEIIARASNALNYANANAASTAQVNAAVREDPNIYPPAAMISRLYVITPKSQDLQREVNRRWTQVRTGQ